MRSSSSRSWLSTLIMVLTGLCTLVTLGILGIILVYVGVQGLRRLDWEALTALPPSAGMTGGGLANAIAGTGLILGLAIIIALPVGVLAGIYVAELSDRPVLVRTIRFATNVLSGLPSIIAGVFAYGLLVVTGILGFSAIAGACALAVLMIPVIVRTTDEALQLVSQDLRWAAASLGASRSQTVLKIVLPAALPGIATGALLAIARAAGETAPLLFTALNSSFFPTGLLDPTPTLSVLIYNFAFSPFPAQQELAWVGSLLLVLLILIASALVRWSIQAKSPFR